MRVSAYQLDKIIKAATAPLERRLERAEARLNGLDQFAKDRVEGDFKVVATMNQLADAAGLEIKVVEAVPEHIEITKKTPARKPRSKKAEKAEK